MKLLGMLLILVSLAGCSDNAMRHIQARYPDCTVNKIESTGNYIKVSIDCGDGEFEKVFVDRG
jgi:hypothetical protein